MLRVRSCSGRVVCDVDPAARKNRDGLVLEELTFTTSVHLRMPPSRVSIHFAEGQKPLCPRMTWADCSCLAAAGNVELLAVVRHFREGGGPELSLAIEMLQHQEVRRLLHSLVDPNIEISHDAHYMPCSPLGIAAYTNSQHVDIAQTLIAARADINGKHFATSPLAAACESRNIQMASFLLGARADADQPSWFMDTPLLVAVSMDSAPLVRLLLRHRANPQPQDRWQRGPIERAFQEQAPRAAACLLRARARVQAYASASSLLHRAARSGSILWAKLLVRGGLEPGSRDERGRLPLQVRKRLPTFRMRCELKRSLCTVGLPPNRSEAPAEAGRPRPPPEEEEAVSTRAGKLRVQKSKTGKSQA